MINLSFFDDGVEQHFYNYLKPKVDKFNSDFTDKVEIHRVESALHNIDVWVGLCIEEVDRIKTKEDLIAYLRKKQNYAIELEKRVMWQHDRFESYKTTMDLLISYLENKPVENTISIPKPEEIKNWIAGIQTNLDKGDIAVIDFALNKISECDHAK